MSTSQIHIEWDNERDEPFIRVQDFPSVRLTPNREGDVDHQVALANDPRIGKWSYRRPYPMSRDQSQWFLNSVKPVWDKSIDALRAQKDDPKAPIPLGFFPMGSVRYVPVPSSSQPDPLLDLGLDPGEHLGLVNFWLDSSLNIPFEEMPSYPLEGKTWEVTYDLSPKVWGKGLGWRMIKSAMDGWIVPVGIEKVVATIQVENVPSAAAVRKCGFVKVKEFPRTWPEDKGGEVRMLSMFEWTAGKH